MTCVEPGGDFFHGESGLSAKTMSAGGIEVDIVADGAEVVSLVRLHQKGFVAAAEEVAGKFVAAVKAGGVGGKKPTHARDEVGLGRLEDEVKVVTHETVGVDVPVGPGAGFAEGLEKKLAVSIIPPNAFTAVAAVENMIEGVLEFDAELTRRG